MSNLNELFPGLEAYDDINVDIDTTGSSDTAADAEPEIVANSETAAQAEEIAADGEKEEAKAELFVRQFTDLCDMQDHIATYGVDRTFLALCNKNDVLGRALRIQMPAMESFDTVGSPASPVSIACVEALDDSLWQKFKDWVKKIWYAIKNFFIKVIDWFKGATGNYELRFGKLKQWYKDATKKGPLEGKELDSVKDVEVYGLQNFDEFDKKVANELSKVINDKLYTDADKFVKTISANIGATISQAKNANGTPTANTNSADIGVLSKEQQEAVDKYLKSVKEAKSNIKKEIKNLKSLTIKSDADIKLCIDAINDLLGNNSHLESFIIAFRTHNRQEEQFKLAVDQTMQRMNQDIQRAEGSSMGAKYRAELTRAVSLVNKIVFNTGAAPLAATTCINAMFKMVSSCRKCVKTAGAAETTV